MGFSTHPSPCWGSPAPSRWAPPPPLGSDMVLSGLLLRLRELDGGQLLPSGFCPEVAALTWRTSVLRGGTSCSPHQRHQPLQDHVPGLLSDSAPADLTVAHTVSPGASQRARGSGLGQRLCDLSPPPLPAQCHSGPALPGEKRTVAEQRAARKKIRLVSCQVGEPPRPPGDVVGARLVRLLVLLPMAGPDPAE